MSEHHGTHHHSHEAMRLLKEAALPTHIENFAVPNGMTRRGMLKALMGASAALALGVPGCERKPKRKIVSRVVGPEYQKPGKAIYYSSTWTEGTCPYGLIIKAVDGRPIKIEGNPEHPINKGASSSAMQASILSLYDPDRLRAPQRGGESVSWEAADSEIVAAIQRATSVVLITRSSLGPSERAIIDEFRRVCPQVRHFVHETIHDTPRRTAWKKIYGTDGEVLPRFDKARIIVSLDADILGTDGAVLENIRTFSEGRRLDDATHKQAQISRLYTLESTMTLTGSNADCRVRLRPSQMGGVVTALRLAAAGDDHAMHDMAAKHGLPRDTLVELVKDLHANRGESLVVAGPHLPASVHANVAMLNDELGTPGHTLGWNPTPATLPVTDPGEVEAVLGQGADVVICLGVNPVYDWPGGNFTDLLGKSGLSIGHGLCSDETSSACSISLPSSHTLESWNDAEPRTGLRTLCQPVIAPLFDARQEAESLLVWTRSLAGGKAETGEQEDWHGYVRQRWQAQLVAEGNSRNAVLAWEDALRTGGRIRPNSVAFPSLDRRVAEAMVATTPSGDGDYELVILPHPTILDGRFANNGWLQELPDPVTKVVWDNVATISPETARKLGAAEGDVIAITVGGNSVDLPVLIQAGATDGVVATTLGHGRTRGGTVCVEAAGTNAAPLLGRSDPAVPRVAVGIGIRKTGDHRKPVRTQKESSMHGRPIALDGTLDEYRHDAAFVKHRRHLPAPADLYEPYDYSKGHKWAMAIDLGACVGCSACVTACQAENNIPIVGKEQCDAGREMHWMRIDRYQDGTPDDLKIHHQPMLCQHCDNAPCESVCPVNATSHSPEGLNEMTYNRCVGTRYCSNNCPYKVRRFNFLRYHGARLRDPVQELAFNPQVTVRGIGVMEKCTFCVQRINDAKYKALNREEILRDGTIQTACEQACPAQAIVFGDANDPDSRVARLRASQRSYHVLEELNVKPNVTYLARVRNRASGDHDVGGHDDGGHEA